MPARRGGGWALLSDSTSVQTLCECACMLPVSGALVRQCRRCPRLTAMASAVEQAWRNVCKAPAHSNGLCFVFRIFRALRHCTQQHRRTQELIKSMLGMGENKVVRWDGQARRCRVPCILPTCMQCCQDATPPLSCAVPCSDMPRP